MLKILKSLIVLLSIILVLFVIIGFSLPKNYTVSRSIVIDATPQQIHKYVNNLKKWPKWSPFAENDPTLVFNMGDKTSGEGANSSWTSKDSSGSLVITSSSPDKGIKYDLEFLNGNIKTRREFIYVREGQNTKVIWEMTGSRDTPVLGGYFAAKMDSYFGKDLDNGLKNLKKVVEENK
jgi:hypothetical protein